MGTKMKGFYKGFKYTLSQFFVVKEREIEIGYPTDVKHVAHIGWDGPSGSAPSWMNQFKTGPDFAASSIGNASTGLSPWTSQDFGASMRLLSGFNETPEHASPMKKKQKRKKKSSTSSPKSNSDSPSKSSRAAKAKAKTKMVECNANAMEIEVA